VIRRPRPSWWLLVAAFALLITTGTLSFIAGKAVRSPEQVAADSAAPSRTTLSEPVRRMRVTKSVAFDGQVVPRYNDSVLAPASASSEGEPVVTRMNVQLGDRVRSGDVVAEVSGRPLFVMPGSLPAYRTLAPGDVGPDVAQLQTALTTAGYQISDDWGHFGASTSFGVQSLYAAKGYAPTVAGGEDLESAKAGVLTAQRALAESRASKPTAMQLTFALEDLSAAQHALEEANRHYGAEMTLGDVTYVQSLPATVSKMNASVGDRAEGELLTLSSGVLVVRGSPASAGVRGIRIGDKVRLLLAGGGEKAGVLTRAAAAPAVASTEGDGTESVGSEDAVTYTIEARGRLASSRKGLAVRVVVATTEARHARLAVPISAISGNADGSFSVTVQSGNGTRPVAVRTGLIGDGYVQVFPTTGGSLAEGDEVIVGNAEGS